MIHCRALVVVVVVIATGCSWSLPDAQTVVHERATTCSTSKALPTADLVLLASGVALIVLGGRQSQVSPADDDVTGGPYMLAVFGVPGALMAIFGGSAASHGFDSVEACRRRAALAPPVPASPETKLLAELTASARIKARAGDCDSVRILAERVRRLDAGYYRTVVVPDPVLGRCWSLDAPTTPAP